MKQVAELVASFFLDSFFDPEDGDMFLVIFLRNVG
jgi:hypothetical protein